MAPKGASAPAAHQDARGTTTLDGQGHHIAPDGKHRRSPHSRAPIPLLDAVRAQSDWIQQALEANTVRSEAMGCLFWTVARNTDGRGRITLRVDDRRVQFVVPRVVYALEHDIEPGSRLVLHGLCDRPECCAIEHLRLGSFADNVRDMLSRGRARIGVDHPFARLREKDIAFVLSRLETHTDREIAEALGHIVCRRTICSIRRGETWRHLTGIPRRDRRDATGGGV